MSPLAWKTSPPIRPCSPSCVAAAGPNRTAPPWPAATYCAPCAPPRPLPPLCSFGGCRRGRGPLSSHAMTSDTTSPPSTAFRAAGDLRLLTWPALDASGAGAAVTARAGGVSSGPYESLNLSLSVGDDPGCVRENRRRLATAFGAKLGDFVFARQVHGAGVRVVTDADRGAGAFSPDDAIGSAGEAGRAGEADALVTASPGVVPATLTADGVPILLHDPVAGGLACVHAGWR